MIQRFSFLNRRETKNTTTPAIAIKLPHKANQPVETKRNNQMQIDNATGTGYNHILNGRSFVPNLSLNNTRPMDCPINCINIRIAKIESIAWPSLNSMLNTNPSTHKKISETYGKFFVGCSLEKTFKKFPSTAAA